MQKYKVNIVAGTVFFVSCVAAALSAPLFFEVEWIRLAIAKYFFETMLGGIFVGMLMMGIGVDLWRKGKNIPLLRYVGYLIMLATTVLVSMVMGQITFLNWAEAPLGVTLLDAWSGGMIILAGVVAAMLVHPHESYYQRRCDC